MCRRRDKVRARRIRDRRKSRQGHRRHVRKNDADRDLAVIGTISRVEGAAAVVKANFAVNMGAESLSQSGCIFER